MRNAIVTAPGIAACLICLGAAAPALAGTPAEFFNEFDWAPTAPKSGPTNFEIVFAGNEACQIPPQNSHDGSTNPFKNPNPITTTYDPASNTTTVAFSGSALKPGQRYHFGLNQGFSPTPPLQVISKMWTYADAAPSPLPIVSVSPPAPISPKGPFKYAIVYLEAAFEKGGKTYGSWYEIPYTPAPGAAPAVARQPQISFRNFGKEPLYITNAGIQLGLLVPTAAACQTVATCGANAKLLNALDFAKTPPPGQPGTRFVPLTTPPAEKLLPTKVVAHPTACAVKVGDK